MMETAVMTNSPVIAAFMQMAKVEHPVEGEVNDQKVISTLETSEGWLKVCEVIDHYITQLDRMQGMIEENDTVESIGYRFLACRVARSYLESVKALPKTLDDTGGSE
jgi:hypothetical protein